MEDGIYEGGDCLLIMLFLKGLAYLLFIVYCDKHDKDITYLVYVRKSTRPN